MKRLRPLPVRRRSWRSHPLNDRRKRRMIKMVMVIRRKVMKTLRWKRKKRKKARRSPFSRSPKKKVKRKRQSSRRWTMPSSRPVSKTSVHSPMKRLSRLLQSSWRREIDPTQCKIYSTRFRLNWSAHSASGPWTNWLRTKSYLAKSTVRPRCTSSTRTCFQRHRKNSLTCLMSKSRYAR